MALKVGNQGGLLLQRKLARIVIELSASEPVRKKVSAFADKTSFVEFAPAGTVWEFDTIIDATQKFLETGNAAEAEKFLKKHLDNLDVWEDLYQEINRSTEYAELAQQIALRAAEAIPQLPASHIENKAFEAAFSALTDEVKKRDKSQPLDVLKGCSAAVVYSPGTDNKKPGQALSTDWWGPISDAVSIKPNEAFVEFMIIANISKDAWLNALEEAGFDLHSDGDLSPYERRQRAVAWAQVNWSVQGEPLVEVRKIVDAVDMCPYGFTPSVTFAIDTHQLVNRDWSKIMEVTGGILGLHDFDNGSGSPLRFEGTCFLPVEPKNLILHDTLEHNIASCHGFRQDSFCARVADRPTINQSVNDLKKQIEFDRNAPQLDISTLAKTALINFRPEIDDLAEDILATDLDISAVDAALVDALAEKCEELTARMTNAEVKEAVRAFARSQTDHFGCIGQRDKIAVLIGLTHPEKAASLIRELAGLSPRI